ncbi:hypothetical protein [Cognatilysobacter segetis]|uniref:hypothetical protein n=1 Tax=Cognatilysobacter segetis TaxID=2492394 RepID=UPI00106144CA|nr:hypothetical protein [Lysobacter segetis]
MHDAFPPGAPRPPPHYTGRWRHDLSNEVNAVTMATSAARHMIQMGDIPAAMINLARAEDAAMRCIDLLRHMPPSP